MELSNISYTFVLYIIFIAVVVGTIVNFFYNTPQYKRINEPFYGGVARGAGHPDCLRTLPEGSEILTVFLGRMGVDPAIWEGNADYRELQLILSKLGCLKKDLLSPSGIVEATRYQAFETAHDRINNAEVAAMCLSQTIPSRDLDIIFATWRNRGNILLRKLCTEFNLKEEEAKKLEELFKKAIEDVYDIAKSRCLKTNFALQNGGQVLGDVSGYMPENLKDARSYDNLYGGLSASGWNGAV